MKHKEPNYEGSLWSGPGMWIRLGTLILLAASLEAGNILTLTGVDGTRGGNVTFYNPRLGATEQAFAGAILAAYDGVGVSPLFCVDLFSNINLASYNSTRIDPRASRNEDRVAWLYLNRLGSVNSTETGLAFQLAIWDIVHDNGDGLSAGVIQNGATSFIGLTQNQVDLANAYVNVSRGMSATTGVSVYSNFDPNTRAPVQNLIGAAAPAPVPEAATLTLVTLGLAGMLFKHARNKRQGF